MPRTPCQGQAGSNANADSTLDPAIAKLVRQIIKGEQCAHEHEEARRTHYFDLDNDGRKDAVVLMAIEGHGCGNNYGFHMAAFQLRIQPVDVTH